MTDASPPPRLASTLLLARDGAAGMELFMVVRHHEIDFASGALVFPGGSVDQSDAKARALCDGADDLPDDRVTARVAAIREAFEECGVLLARRNGAMVSGRECAEIGARWRTNLETREATIAEVAKAEGLTLALDRLTLFSRWLTPPMMPKRFDTFFYIAKAPRDHVLEHDGSEAVDSLWITPSAALKAAESREKTIIFPTRLNLQMAAEARSTADAIERAAAREEVLVMPDVTRDGEHLIMRIPEKAGYGAPAFRIKGMGGDPIPYFD